jgi:hypothetical protein
MMEQWNNGILGLFWVAEKKYDVGIDPKDIDPNTYVARFKTLFQYSNIPSFHGSGINQELL